MTEPLGLIAGEGVFPHLVADGAKAAGRDVVCCGFTGMADPTLAGKVQAYREIGFLKIAGWARYLRKHGCREAIMVGRVHKTHVHLGLIRSIMSNLPDLATLHLYLTKTRYDRRSDVLLQNVADLLERKGITLIDSTTYSKDQMASAGVMGNVPPTDSQQRDADRGWQLCGMLSREDVGQAIAVKDLDILAIEAVEGTQHMIERAGQLCRGGGWTLVKRGNPSGESRWDVPTIAPATMQQLKDAGATALCVEAGQVILLEREKVLAEADRLGIAVFGMEGA